MSSGAVPQSPMSQDAFAVLGGGRMAYVKPARSEDVAFMCPDAPLLAPGQDVFVLYGANGMPILVTDTREAALANAASEQLETVSLH
ncbi:MAG: DUF1150 domain-containing protein [Pseudorhodoplanes sp.]|nr:DUF1150 domain-containing protein [Pseudorhodoplanes sp.]